MILIFYSPANFKGNKLFHTTVSIFNLNSQIYAYPRIASKPVIEGEAQIGQREAKNTECYSHIAPFSKNTSISVMTFHFDNCSTYGKDMKWLEIIKINSTYWKEKFSKSFP